MSGYGGQPPSNWQGPYGQPPPDQNPYGQNPYPPYAPYGQDPYARDPYGPQPNWQRAPYAQQDGHGGAYAAYGPPGIPQQPPPSNAAAVAAIVGNCVGLVFICGIGIAWLPGLILGGIAVNKIQSDPAAARALTKYSWICCGLNFLIEAVIFIVVYVLNH